MFSVLPNTFGVLLLHQNAFTLFPSKTKITKLQQLQSDTKNIPIQTLQGQYESMKNQEKGTKKCIYLDCIRNTTFSSFLFIKKNTDRLKVAEQ